MEMKAHFGASSSMASPTGVKTFPARGHSSLSQEWHVGSMWLSQCTLHNLSACALLRVEPHTDVVNNGTTTGHE